MNPFRSLMVTLGYLVTGRLRFLRERVGDEILLPNGTHLVIFRHAMVAPGRSQPAMAGATFIVKFRVRGMTIRQNIRFSLLPIPFFVGLPGFRSKLWGYIRETGDFQGVYEWDSIAAAEAYSRSFAVRFMTRRSEPGSVSFRIVPADVTTALREP